ncbi:MAG: MgtC/SapB family protein [Ignavibacteriaceae bacterium]
MTPIQDSAKSFQFNFPIPQSVLGPDEFFIIIQKLIIAILIGILIGLEREHSRSKASKIFAGIRTYPLLTMLGFSAALVASITNVWLYGIIFIGYSALITTSYISSAREGRLGGTSEASALLVFILGSLVYWNMILVAAAIAVFTILFLSLKIQLHSFVGKINSEDILAIVKLAIITIIILPLLPNQTIDPFNIFNPRTIWLMVIFVSGIGFVGYILVKYVGKDKGIGLTGFLGGMVSSTAVTFSMSKKSKESEMLAGNYAVGVLLASSVMYLRIFIIVVFLELKLAMHAWLPLIIFGITGLLISYLFKKKIPSPINEVFELKNPLELRFALLFGLIFGIVIVVSKAAQLYLGTEALYGVSAIAGITSVDAIVLSVIHLLPVSINISTAVAAIIIATAANNIVKIVISLYWGSKEFMKFVSIGLGLLVFVSLITLIFYV